MKMKKLATILSVCAMVAMLFSFALTGSAAISYKTITSSDLTYPSSAIQVDWNTDGGMKLTSADDSPLTGTQHIMFVIPGDVIEEYPYLVFVGGTASTGNVWIPMWDNEASAPPYNIGEYTNAPAKDMGFYVVDLSKRTSESASVFVDIYPILATGTENVIFDDFYLASEKPTAARDKNAGSGDGEDEVKPNAKKVNFEDLVFDEKDVIKGTKGEGDAFSVELDCKTAGDYAGFLTPEFTAADVEKYPYLVFDFADTCTNSYLHIWYQNTATGDWATLSENALSGANTEAYNGKKIVADLTKLGLTGDVKGRVYVILCYGEGGTPESTGKTKIDLNSVYFIDDADADPVFPETGYAPAAGIAAVAVLSTAALVVLGKKKK